jgi:ABC-type sugar transport system ATPase subunit
MTPLVQLRGVSKDFRGVLAISNVDFEIRPGEIHAILGRTARANPR